MLLQSRRNLNVARPLASLTWMYPWEQPTARLPQSNHESDLSPPLGERPLTATKLHALSLQMLKSMNLSAWVWLIRTVTRSKLASRWGFVRSVNKGDQGRAGTDRGAREIDFNKTWQDFMIFHINVYDNVRFKKCFMLFNLIRLKIFNTGFLYKTYRTE